MRDTRKETKDKTLKNKYKEKNYKQIKKKRNKNEIDICVIISNCIGNQC